MIARREYLFPPFYYIKCMLKVRLFTGLFCLCGRILDANC